MSRKPQVVTGSHHQRRSLRRKRPSNEKVLKPVRPNVGIEAGYCRQLVALVDAMAASYGRWITAAYRRLTPEMALDAGPFERPLSEAQIELLAQLVHGDRLRGSKADVDVLEGRGYIRPIKTAKGAPPRYELTEIGDALAAELITAATQLNVVVAQLGQRWQRRIDEAAPRLARYFAQSVNERSKRALQDILRQGGISVRFQMSAAQRDVLEAGIHENVALIRSIAAQYHTQVEGLVMRSVTAGRDLASLSKALREQFGVSKRRAALIARDQNNKATAALTRARQKDLGIKYAIWMHSGAGKHPRPKHVRASGRRYEISKGLPIGDKGQYVFPGEEINCRCISKSVIPGFV